MLFGYQPWGRKRTELLTGARATLERKKLSFLQVVSSGLKLRSSCDLAEVEGRWIEVVFAPRPKTNEFQITAASRIKEMEFPSRGMTKHDGHGIISIGVVSP